MAGFKALLSFIVFSRSIEKILQAEAKQIILSHEYHRCDMSLLEFVSSFKLENVQREINNP